MRTDNRYNAPAIDDPREVVALVSLTRALILPAAQIYTGRAVSQSEPDSAPDALSPLEEQTLWRAVHKLACELSALGSGAPIAGVPSQDGYPEFSLVDLATGLQTLCPPERIAVGNGGSSRAARSCSCSCGCGGGGVAAAQPDRGNGANSVRSSLCELFRNLRREMCTPRPSGLALARALVSAACAGLGSMPGACTTAATNHPSHDLPCDFATEEPSS